MGNFTPWSVNRDDTVANSLMTLRTYSAIRNFDPLGLQEHKLPSNLVIACFVDLTNDMGVKGRCTKRLDQKRPDILGSNEWRKELQSLYRVKSRTVTTNEVQCGLKQV